MVPPADLSSPAQALLGSEAPFEVEVLIWIAASTPEPPELSQPEQAQVAAQIVDRELEAVSAKEQSRWPIESAPRKKRKPWSALAPQYLLHKYSIQCSRG